MMNCMTRQELMKQVNQLGFGLKSSLKLNGILIQTDIIWYEDKCDDNDKGEVLMSIDEQKPMKFKNHLSNVKGLQLKDNKRQALYNAVYCYVKTPIKDRKHW